MRAKRRGLSLGAKLELLIIAIVLVVTAGLVGISYYVFCQRVDDDYYDRASRAAKAGTEFFSTEDILAYRDAILSREFQELRQRAVAANAPEILKKWMAEQPAGNDGRDEDGKLLWSLLDEYELINESLASITEMTKVDTTFIQVDVNGVTYNLADPVEDIFYVGSIEESIDEFEDYGDNEAVPPTVYHSQFGWLCTTLEPIMNPETGEPVCLVGADVEMTEIMRERHSFFLNTILFVALFTIVAIAASTVLLRRVAVNPLKQLADAATGFAREDHGNFTKEDVIQLDIKSDDEIGKLYREIQSMQSRIVDYTDNLTRVTAEKERVNTELRTASQIQESMLPDIFPAFPERSEFDLYASMSPAKEVGGDFYDFFLIDEDHLALVIADVSDKGVPAALFMMSSKILINYRAREGGSPGEILTAVNAQLSRDNKSKMFVTVWLGILELSSGRLCCSNAGHEYPVLRQNGVFQLFKDKHGLVLGALTRSKYRDYEIRLRPGDAIFVYTDGVPEASDDRGAFYGLERMTAALNRAADRNPQGILQGVREDVDAFTGEAKQFDDLTMLCLEYKGKNIKTEVNEDDKNHTAD